MKRNNRAFTLIELIMVIVIIGILAAVAIPKFAGLTQDAQIAATKGALGGIRAAVAIDYARSATSGTASFPSSVTGALFADGRVPKNEVVGSSVVDTVTAIPLNNAISTSGWWYISDASKADVGRVGAYIKVVIAGQNSSDW